jgi:hypothetical protein
MNKTFLSLLAGGIILLGVSTNASWGATPAPAPTPAPSPAPNSNTCSSSSPCYSIVNAVGSFMGTGATGDTSGSCIFSQISTQAPGAIGALQCSGGYDVNGTANGINILMTVFLNPNSSSSTGTSTTCSNKSKCYPIIQLVGQKLGSGADFKADCTPTVSGDLSNGGYLTCPGAYVDAAGNPKEISVIVTTTPNMAARRK